MLTTILRAIDPAARAEGDERIAVRPQRHNLPFALADGSGDFACGHCGLTLLRDGLADPIAAAWLVRCPACGWDNAVPRG
jgi:predicted RNA-binding Zn-ribbon protein involved in translation (DUF1610 family)